jgi:hypothetical protein
MIGHSEQQANDTASGFEASIRRHIRYSLGKRWEKLSSHDLFMAIALTVRDWMVDSLLGHGGALSKSRCEVSVLSLDGVPHRPVTRQ